MTAREVEARVLAAVIADSAKLSHAAELELEDFGFARHRALFEAVRNLQASGADVDLESVSQAVAIAALERVGTSAIGYCEIRLFAAELIAGAGTYEDTFGDEAAMFIFEADLRQLRIYADRRRNGVSVL